MDVETSPLMHTGLSYMCPVWLIAVSGPLSQELVSSLFLFSGSILVYRELLKEWYVSDSEVSRSTMMGERSTFPYSWFVDMPSSMSRSPDLLERGLASFLDEGKER